MNWVEKLSFEKIPRLSDISEQEHHYQVLLTPDNIFVVRPQPDPLHPPGHSLTVAFRHCGRGELRHY